MTVKLKPLPMKAAQEFWNDKVMMSPSQFKRLSDPAKLKAFSVSGIAKGDELSTVFESIKRAVNDGIPFADFQKSCKEIFDRRGWTGVSAWRVDNIFRTNIQTAYNVGQYKEMQAVKKTRPYWQYSAVNDTRTRPLHRALDGKIFEAEHAFWDVWYPPNGFRCRCGVTTLSQREIDRDGLTIETKDPTGGLIEPKTPDGITMPARPLMPDPGFSYHPGKTAYGGIVDAEIKPGKWQDLDNLKGPSDFHRQDIKNVGPKEIPAMDESMLLPGGLTDTEYRDAFISRYGEEKVVTDAAREPVILSLRSFLIDKTPGAKEQWKFNKPGHGQSIPVMETVLTAPYEIWLAPQISDAGKIRLSRRYITLWKTADKNKIGGFAVYEVNGGVFSGVTSFIPTTKKGGQNLKYLEKQRQGILLYGRKGKGRSGSQTGNP